MVRGRIAVSWFSGWVFVGWVSLGLSVRSTWPGEGEEKSLVSATVNDVPLFVLRVGVEKPSRAGSFPGA
jgi:hypothetical protein